MARTDTLNNYLTDIATAIKTKKGDETPINASKFDEEIANLPSGGEESDFKITNAGYLFYKGYRKDCMEVLISHIDSSCSNFESMFEDYSSLKSAPMMNLSGATSVRNMFAGCSDLTYIPLYDLSKVTNAYGFLDGCHYLLEIPLFNTSNVQDFSMMFSGVMRAKELPLLDTSNGTKFQNFLVNCYELTKVPQFNISKAQNLNYAFANLHAIVDFPELDTSNATDMSCMLYLDKKLVTIPAFDCSKCNNISNIVYGCTELENIGGFINIGKAYTRTYNNTSNYTIDLKNCTKLTYESLMNVLNNLYDLNLSYNVAEGGKLYTQKLVLGTTNIAKLEATEEGQQAMLTATNKGWIIS